MPAKKTTSKKEEDVDRIIDKVLARREDLVRAKDKTKDLVSKHPFVSIAIAAAVGAGVALLVSEVSSRAMYHEPTFREKVRGLFG